MITQEKINLIKELCNIYNHYDFHYDELFIYIVAQNDFFTGIFLRDLNLITNIYAIKPIRFDLKKIFPHNEICIILE